MRYWTLLAVVFLVACSDTPSAPPEAFSPEPCVPPKTLSNSIASQSVSLPSLSDALNHAAGPLASTLGDEASVRTVRDAVGAITAQLDRVDADRACRLLYIASSALDNLPDDPATLPDRTDIRLILALTSQAIDSMIVRR
jgi:hypothetical protein